MTWWTLKTDIRKVAIGGYDDTEDYLDGVLMRHPMAKGALSFGAGLAWAVAWAVVALAGAYWLNPVCLYLFAGGCSSGGALLQIVAYHAHARPGQRRRQKP